MSCCLHLKISDYHDLNEWEPSLTFCLYGLIILNMLGPWHATADSRYVPSLSALVDLLELLEELWRATETVHKSVGKRTILSGITQVFLNSHAFPNSKYCRCCELSCFKRLSEKGWCWEKYKKHERGDSRCKWTKWHVTVAAELHLCIHTRNVSGIKLLLPPPAPVCNLWRLLPTACCSQDKNLWPFFFLSKCNFSHVFHTGRVQALVYLLTRMAICGLTNAGASCRVSRVHMCNAALEATSLKGWFSLLFHSWSHSNGIVFKMQQLTFFFFFSKTVKKKKN